VLWNIRYEIAGLTRHPTFDSEIIPHNVTTIDCFLPAEKLRFDPSFAGNLGSTPVFGVGA
jgi:hypothetical protein